MLLFASLSGIGEIHLELGRLSTNSAQNLLYTKTVDMPIDPKKNGTSLLLCNNNNIIENLFLLFPRVPLVSREK